LRVVEEVVVFEDDDEEEQTATAERFTGDNDSRKGSSSCSRPSVTKENETPVSSLTTPASINTRHPPPQQQNGGLSDISECEEETAEAIVPIPTAPTKFSSVETVLTSPAALLAGTVTPATASARPVSPVRSPERGRIGSVSDKKCNGDSKISVSGDIDLPSADAQGDALQPPLKRRKRTKTKSSPGRDEGEQHSDTEPASVADSGSGPDALKSQLDHIIPTDIRFDPKSLENKPKGLVDALSNFFTPGLKRTSRTAMNSLLKPEIRPAETASSKSSSCDGVVTTAENTKKVRLSVEEKEPREIGSAAADSGGGDAAERKRHASAGQQQVKSLYDGLSHLYSDCDSRLRSVPTTNYSEKSRTAAGGEAAGTSAAAVSGCGIGVGGATAAADSLKAGKSPERISSPHRMSDSELKEKEKSKGTAETEKSKTGGADGEKEEKGTSKKFARKQRKRDRDRD
jgi:hypothetical protein